MSNPEDVRIILTGGTFEKVYDPKSGGLVFHESSVPRILTQAGISPRPTIEQLFLVDSLDMTPDQRGQIVSAAERAPEQKLVIVHGTDTMLETANALRRSREITAARKTIAVTGAMVPYSVKGTDARYNLERALNDVHELFPGVYISMGSLALHPAEAIKNYGALEFQERVSQLLMSETENSKPFIHRPGAVEFVDTLQSAGFMLNDKARQKLTAEAVEYSGSGYIWLHHAIALWINNPDGENPLFSSQMSEVHLPKLTLTGYPGMDLLLDLIRQAYIAQQTGARHSEVPVSTETRMPTFDCKDVEANYALAFKNGRLNRNITLNGKPFWHKTYGADSYLSLESIAYNGVVLPPGSVFTLDPQGGLKFGRVTALTLGPTDEAPFGLVHPYTQIHGLADDALTHRLFEEFAADRRAA